MVLIARHFSAICIFDSMPDEQLISSEDNSLESRLTEVFEHHQNGYYDRAEFHYRELIEQYPGIWQLYFNCGLLLFELGRYEEALDLYLGGLAINDSSQDLLYNTGICQKELGRFEEAIASYQRALEVAPDDIDCRYNLAGCYRSLGEDDQAAHIYASILAHTPTHLPSLNNLAYLTHKHGENEGARELYERILELNPEHASADHMRAALSGEARNHSPNGYVREVFDQFAGHYEASLTDNLGYDLPSELLNIYLHLLPGGRPQRLLDLGCGTGLVGEQFCSLCQSMTGVDISRKMLDVAHEKKLYNYLHVSEIIEFLRTDPETNYDLIVCADVLPYLGDLEELFNRVSYIMATHGHFMFSVEHFSSDADSPVLQQSGRFAHSGCYVFDTAARAGWNIISQTLLNLRKEREGWIQGSIYVMSLAPVK